MPPVKRFEKSFGATPVTAEMFRSVALLAEIRKSPWSKVAIIRAAIQVYLDNLSPNEQERLLAALAQPKDGNDA